jgi:hypothetical protein
VEVTGRAPSSAGGLAEGQSLGDHEFTEGTEISFHRELTEFTGGSLFSIHREIMSSRRASLMVDSPRDREFMEGTEISFTGRAPSSRRAQSFIHSDKEITEDSRNYSPGVHERSQFRSQ